VGTGCGHLKTGAPARGERVAKYNRLLELAASDRGQASAVTVAMTAISAMSI
jgi:enolase